MKMPAQQFSLPFTRRRQAIVGRLAERRLAVTD
jgi:hypothetical protein